jgi:uncharacterized protein (TIGR03435 family)
MILSTVEFSDTKAHRLRPKNMKLFAFALVAGLWAAPACQCQAFDAVSVKAAKSGVRGYSIHPYPNRLSCSNVTLKLLIASAYHVYDFQISGGPKWAGDDRFDIEAKAAGSVSEKALMTMLQQLLAERFHLELRRESKVSSVYALEVSKAGSKLKPSQDPETPIQFRVFQRKQITSRNSPLSQLTETFSWLLGRPVVDRTGLTGNFDYELEWTPDEVQVRSDESAPSTDSSNPALSSALQQQLGLRLIEKKEPVEILIVEQAQKPSDN